MENRPVEIKQRYVLSKNLYKKSLKLFIRDYYNELIRLSKTLPPSNRVNLSKKTSMFQSFWDNYSENNHGKIVSIVVNWRMAETANGTTYLTQIFNLIKEIIEVIDHHRSFFQHITSKEMKKELNNLKKEKIDLFLRSGENTRNTERILGWIFSNLPSILLKEQFRFEKLMSLKPKYNISDQEARNIGIRYKVTKKLFSYHAEITSLSFYNDEIVFIPKKIEGYRVTMPNVVQVENGNFVFPNNIKKFRLKLGENSCHLFFKKFNKNTSVSRIVNLNQYLSHFYIKNIFIPTNNHYSFHKWPSPFLNFSKLFNW